MVKNPLADVGHADLILASGRSPGEGNGNPFQYSCLKNSIDRGSWQATVHGFTKNQDVTERLSTSIYITNMSAYRHLKQSLPTISEPNTSVEKINT